MDHQAQVRLLLQKHVLDKQMFLSFPVMQQNFVKCMWEWEQKKSENCLKKQDNVLHQSFILTRLMQWEIEVEEF